MLILLAMSEEVGVVECYRLSSGSVTDLASSSVMLVGVSL